MFFNVCFLIIFIVLNTFYFIKEFYSIKRLFLGYKSIIYNDIFLLISIVFYFITILMSFINYNIFKYLNYLSMLLLLLFLPKVVIKLSKRGIRQIVLSFLLVLIIVFIKEKYIFLFLPFIAIFIVIISYYLLLPFESIINNYYIKKAKNKLMKVNPIVIGVTGSFSKTTFKLYLHHVLKQKYRVEVSFKNYNTLLGLTRFINEEMSNFPEIIICEIGIDEPFSMHKFSKLLNLDIACILGVGKVHLATFKSENNIVKSKAQIDNLLKKDGIVFINDKYDTLKDYPYKHKKIYYKEKILSEKFTSFQKNIISGVIEVATFLNIDETTIYKSLKSLPSIKRRKEIKKQDNLTVIDDSYNINYDGFLSSIKKLEEIKGIKIVITGGLIELGKSFYKDNYNLGKNMQNIDILILVSKNKRHPLGKGYKNNFNKLYIVSSLKKAYNIVNQIKEEKVVLLSAKGEDFLIN